MRGKIKMPMSKKRYAKAMGRKRSKNAEYY